MTPEELRAAIRDELAMFWELVKPAIAYASIGDAERYNQAHDALLTHLHQPT